VIRQAKLGDFLAKRSRGIVPASTPDETFELYSVPAFEGKRPEVVTGGQIGSNKQIVDPGTVLLCKINPRINRAWTVGSFTKYKKIASTEWIPFPPHADLEPRYLAHYLSRREIRDYLAANASGVGGSLMRVKASTFEDLPLPLPNLDEQRRIVAELEKQFSRLDEAVANLKRVKANLKRQAAAVLSAAVSGLLSERAQPRSSTERPEMAPLVELPAGWSWATAADVCEIVASGSTPKPDEMTAGSGEVPFIKVYNLGFDGSLDFTVKPTFIRRAIHEGQLARSRCAPGDVLMNIVGPPLGKVSVVPDEYAEWNINQAVVTFRVGPRMSNRLLAYWLMSPPVQRRIERTSKATAGQFNVQVSTCRKLVLPLPPLDEQHRIVAEVDRRLSIVREVEAEVDANLKRAQALRQAVLARAFAAPRASRAATVAV
jgi:type I restriction enzyme S subunit